MDVRFTSLPDPARRPVEIVERKGLGHPDTICDLLAEAASRALCRHYLDRFGFILHHNVDKVLLAGGTSRPAFGGGEIVAPIEIFFAGRATADYRGTAVPVADIVVEACESWLGANIPGLDPARHVRIHPLVRPGSPDLVALFERQHRTGVYLANDTSAGSGYAPLSPLEDLVLAVAPRSGRGGVAGGDPAFGPDVKVMGVRRGAALSLTLSCAFIGRHVASIAAYALKKAALGQRLAAEAARLGWPQADTAVNAADDPNAGSVYLTVTGTSAECGDDGEVGRGNRANGLIALHRPMTMEAVAGKNPVTHVGKLYNVAAHRIAAAAVAAVPEIEAAECHLVSRIGADITRPQLAELRLSMRDGAAPEALAPKVEPVLREHLAGLKDLWRAFVAGEIAVC